MSIGNPDPLPPAPPPPPASSNWVHLPLWSRVLGTLMALAVVGAVGWVVKGVTDYSAATSLLRQEMTRLEGRIVPLENDSMSSVAVGSVVGQNSEDIALIEAKLSAEQQNGQAQHTAVNSLLSEMGLARQKIDALYGENAALRERIARLEAQQGP